MRPGDGGENGNLAQAYRDAYNEFWRDIPEGFSAESGEI
jgi:hypothetical protein